MNKRLTESQIVGILKEAEAGTSVPKSTGTTVLGKVHFISGARSMAAWNVIPP